MQNKNNRKKGDIAESIAVDYLKEKKYTIICTNYQKKCGEIDIIAKKGTYIFFIEVKYRKTLKNGYPREAVSLKKQEKIKQTALIYISENDIINTDFSFDVVEIIDKKINYIKNAFE